MKKHIKIKSNSIRSSLNQSQSGFSLIEIMVAALVLSIGILGVVSLQLVGLKGTQQSYMKQQAMSVVQNLTERMRSNKPAVFAGNYRTDSETFDCTANFPSCSNQDCSPQEIAIFDLHNLICGYEVGTAARTGGIKNVSPDDINTFNRGKLTLRCADIDGVISTSCLVGNVQIQLNWTEREINNEEVTEDSLVINTRISQ